MLNIKIRGELKFIPFFLSIVLLITGCDNTPPNRLTELNGQTMGTTYTVKIVDLPNAVKQEALHQQIDEVLVHVNNVMSTYQKDSELSQFNQNKSTDWLEISTELSTVVQAALNLSKLSGGAFDITVGPLVNLWGFGPTFNVEDNIPSDDAIADIQQKIGYQNLELRASPRGLRKAVPEMYVDLSSIAKGYGVDQIAELLESHDIANYMVEVGGELRTKGKNADDVLWRIAVEKPLANERSIQTIIQISGLGMATSGDYRIYFEKDGIRYSHIINATTGKPVTHKLASVTVLHPSSMQADGLATMFLVLGPEQAQQLAEQENIAALFLIKANDGFTQKATPAFQPYLLDDAN